MRHAASAMVVALALPCLASPRAAEAQAGAQMRGVVVDEEGQPIPDVEVEIEYVGEGQKKVYRQKTNKKGGFVRVGLPPGNYKIYFRKEGYKTYGIDTWLSLGGLSEICGESEPGAPCADIVLQKAPVVVNIPGGTGAAGAEGEAREVDSEEAARLGAAYMQAVEAIKGERWGEAESALKEVLAQIPDQPAVHFNLGHVYRQKKDFAAAEGEFRRTMELDPDDPDAYVALAALYEAQGKGTEAVTVLTEAAPRFEESAKFQTALGATAMNEGREKDAEAAFTKVVALDPTNAQVQYYLATLALNRGDKDDAIGHLEAFVAHAPAGSPDLEVAKALLEALRK